MNEERRVSATFRHLALSLCSLLAVWELYSSPLSLDNPTFSFITVM